MAPFALVELLGKPAAYLVFLLIGFCFGAVLEMAGFANSPKLAAQFYFKDLTVLKVMFGAIVVAMLLIFLASGLGVLDYNRLYVNPTYLLPGIVGGLIMGFGFIIGGFCPGTSLVAVSTLKLDGIAFALGALFGIFVFGESVSAYEGFWSSTYMGRYTLPELFGLSTGTVALVIVVMALVAFWLAEKAESRFGDRDPRQEPKARYIGAAALCAAGIWLVIMGQPTLEDRWEWVAEEKQPLLTDRAVQIHPGELLDLMADNRLNLLLYDLRDEADYNLFHLTDARRTTATKLGDRAPELLAEPEPTVVMLMSNDEQRATEAWKHLVAQAVPNVYILEGGVNNWLDVFGHEGHERCVTEPVPGTDELRHVFDAALGSRSEAADPDHHEIDIEYQPKVKLERKKQVGGSGCG